MHDNRCYVESPEAHFAADPFLPPSDSLRK